ncbi:DMT family transporter [Marinomonas algarum]|uniref:Guanidinium exporter n=1 Tax=Marinomonas algarum TaxID=2883105 RepID=A0A9X1LF96_9GAMM|nr:multidrug efflux SMR transporter [Marinomonas algarum]MCB5162836.1 multidrug efflux SMR transporter [Marinomonas algarum]
MAWYYLFIAGVLECMWAIGLKYSNGFTKLWPSVFSVTLIVVSLFLLSLSMKTIPVGMAYAIWTGIGATSLVIIGMVFMGEPAGLARIVCLLMIIAGIVGLQLMGES